MRSNLQVMNPCPQAHCGGSLIPSRTAPGRMACVLCSRTDGMRPGVSRRAEGRGRWPVVCERTAPAAHWRATGGGMTQAISHGGICLHCKRWITAATSKEWSQLVKGPCPHCGKRGW